MVLSEDGKWYLITALHNKGMGLKEIAKEVGVDFKTVRKAIRAKPVKVYYEDGAVKRAMSRISESHTKKHITFLVVNKMAEKLGKKEYNLITKACGITLSALYKFRKATRPTLARKLVVQSIVDKEYWKKLKELKRIHTKRTMHYLLVDRFARAGDVGKNSIAKFLEHVGIKRTQGYVGKMIVNSKKLSNGRIETKKPVDYDDKLVDHELVDQYAEKVQEYIGEQTKEYVILKHLMQKPKYSLVNAHEFLKRCPETKTTSIYTLKDWVVDSHYPRVAGHFANTRGVQRIVNRILKRNELEKGLTELIKLWPPYRSVDNLDYLHDCLPWNLKKHFTVVDIEHVLKNSPMFVKAHGGRWSSKVNKEQVEMLDRKTTTYRLKSPLKEIFLHRHSYRLFI